MADKEEEDKKKRRRRRRRTAIVGADSGALDTTTRPNNSGRLAKARELANQERHRLVAMGSALAAGYARKKGMLQKLPSLPLVGPEGTLGLAAYIGAKATNSKTLSHVATGLLSVAAHAIGEGRDLTGPAAGVQGGSVEGDEILGDMGD